MGDPAGIGPEVVRKALRDKSLYKICRPLVIGDARTPLNPGRASYEWVVESVKLALSGKVQGVVHAPISKLAWKKTGVRHPGHTELIAELCGTRSFAMAIASGPIRTVLATRHIPLAEVPGSLSKKEILNCVRLAMGWMKGLGLRRPKIGVCALNPHGGESGLIGREEISIIAPAVKEARKKYGTGVSGPIPADTAFKELKSGRLDCLVTLYHDQSLIPAKLYDAFRVINITLGLPFPRTSPGHGTAFDIAGKNLADPRPMIEAILTCAKLCR